MFQKNEEPIVVGIGIHGEMSKQSIARKIAS